LQLVHEVVEVNISLHILWQPLTLRCNLT